MPLPLIKLCPGADSRVPDAELLTRFTTHSDEEAFAELVRRHGPLVYRVCRRVAPAVADDAFQAAFITLACRARAIRTPGALAGWLVGVAGRVSRQMRSADQRRAQRERDAGRAESAGPEPLDHLERGDLAATLDDELSRLPEKLLGPLVLCLLRGRTHEQAARELDSSPRTLRRRLERAKALLRTRLERRGVVPAVAAALVAGLGGPGFAIPPGLVRQTVESAFGLLVGACPPVGVVVKGVTSGMAKLKVSALMATAAAVLVFLGVGWSNEEPPPAPLPQPLPAPTAAAARAEPPKQSAPVSEKPSADVPADVDGVPFRGPNFVVYAPTAMMARVIASEAEYHRRIFARKWLGRELPRWDKPCVIHFERHPQSGGTTTFTFGKEKAGQPALTSAEMTLHGEFMHVLANELPHEVMHAVLATDFGKPIPRWADEGIAVLAESEEEQFRHETRLRELLNAGRGIRLRVLLRMTDYPRDMLVLYAQGRSLARFLVNRPLPEGAQLLKNLPHVGRLFEGPWSDGRRRFLAFVYLGMQENTPESWGKAAKDVYGFESIDALEEAWMDSLRKPPGNVIKPKSKPAPSQPEPTTGRDFIPPAKLPTAPKAGPPPEPRP